MSVAEAIVRVFTLYAACGLIFAVAFVSVGIHRVDAQSRGSGIAFRLIVLPGVAALWPLLLARWLAPRLRGGAGS